MISGNAAQLETIGLIKQTVRSNSSNSHVEVISQIILCFSNKTLIFRLKLNCQRWPLICFWQEKSRCSNYSKIMLSCTLLSQVISLSIHELWNKLHAPKFCQNSIFTQVAAMNAMHYKTSLKHLKDFLLTSLENDTNTLKTTFKNDWYTILNPPWNFLELP